MLRCPECQTVGKYHEEDEDSLGNTWYECDECGNQFTSSDAEEVDQ